MFGYVNDLRAEANVYLAVDKVSQGVKIKWKSHNKAINLKRPSLLEFSFWLKDQADIYDDVAYYPRKPDKTTFHLHKIKRWFDRSNGEAERQNAFSSSISSRHKLRNPLCVMGDGKGHKLPLRPTFKALGVRKRLSDHEVLEHKLCFCCLGSKHWLSNCPHQQQCGVNGRTRFHNALLHDLRNVTSNENGGVSLYTSPVVEPTTDS